MKKQNEYSVSVWNIGNIEVNNTMKATIIDLWDTGRQIIGYPDSDTNRPTTFADLKKCENVIMGDHIDNNRNAPREVLIDNDICIVAETTVRHPAGGTMYILEVY